jgi:fructose-bisphosphate aldolase class II
MKLVTSRKDVLEIFTRCRAAGVAVFSPNGELPAEIEGLLLGGQTFAEQHGIAELPIAVGMTGIYPDNPQFRKISTGCVTRTDLSGFEGGDVREGCELWLRTLAVYEDLPGRFPNVRLLPFIDHGWATDETDAAMLHDESVVQRMAIIMHDASKLDYEDNIRMTAEYVQKYGDRVVIEGASDKIYDPADIARLKLSHGDQLSKPEDVEKFVRETGVDLVVPNLGTEHRSVGAGRAERRYERELAQAIRDQVGSIMALHGTSCLEGKVGDTANDGICKVNFYTAMAVGAGQKIYGLLKQYEKEVVAGNNLWLNSESFGHDVRRRHVAEVCFDMLKALGYARLGAQATAKR